MNNFTVKLQVHKNHYFNLNYDSKARWISYWYQINEIVQTRPKSVLEIGVGNKTVSDYLKKINIKVVTCDFDKTLNPDVQADVRKLPFKKNQFDTALCAEVLEHLPYRNFKKALMEINRVAKNYAVITLPHFSITNVYIGAKLIPFIPKKEIAWKVDIPIEHKFLGEHYWEIGKKGYNLNSIKDVIEKCNFTVTKCFYPNENPKHQFFVLRTNK